MGELSIPFSMQIEQGIKVLAIFSRERFTTGTANRGFVTQPKLLEKLFTQN